MIDYRKRLVPVLRALEQEPDLSMEASVTAIALGAGFGSSQAFSKAFRRHSALHAGRYAQSRYLITDRSQYGPRWQEHIGDIVAAGLVFGDGPASSSITV